MKESIPRNRQRGAAEQEILKAWKRGDRTPYEVAKITGYTLKTIAKYLPMGLEQERHWRDA